MFNSLLRSLHPQDFFGLSGPFKISLIPVTMPLVLSESLTKPSLCSRAVFLFSVLQYVSIWYLVPQRCLSSAQISSLSFSEKATAFIYFYGHTSRGGFCSVLQFIFGLATQVLIRLLLLPTVSDTFLVFPWVLCIFCSLGLI